MEKRRNRKIQEVALLGRRVWGGPQEETGLLRPREGPRIYKGGSSKP